MTSRGNSGTEVHSQFVHDPSSCPKNGSRSLCALIGKKKKKAIHNFGDGGAMGREGCGGRMIVLDRDLRSKTAFAGNVTTRGKTAERKEETIRTKRLSGRLLKLRVPTIEDPTK